MYPTQQVRALRRVQYVCREATGIEPHALRYAALAADGAMLFESARTHPLYGNRSVLCMGSLARFEVPAGGDTLFAAYAGHVAVAHGRAPVRGNPLRALAALLRPLIGFAGATAAPPLAAGYIGYEAGRFAEKMPQPQSAGPALPELLFVIPQAAAVHLHNTGRTFLYGYGEDAADWLEYMESMLRNAQPPAVIALDIRSVESNFTKDRYLAAVQRVKDYIAAGDIYQANLSQQFRAVGRLDACAIYLNLAARSSAPFFAWLDIGAGNYVLSSSMELFLLTSGGKVTTRPIKGTRPRGHTRQQDDQMRSELENSLKDKAELTMIIDLERNDLGRVCEYGTVRVPSRHFIESHPHVHHMVATVEGRLHAGTDVFDLIRATFPGGSITGAPKVRTMQIINELEPTRRSVYCGSIGFIDLAGDCCFNIAIRTMLVTGETAWFSVGGGLTADSAHEAEYQETLDKARGMALALGLAWPPAISRG